VCGGFSERDEDVDVRRVVNWDEVDVVLDLVKGDWVDGDSNTATRRDLDEPVIDRSTSNNGLWLLVGRPKVERGGAAVCEDQWVVCEFEDRHRSALTERVALWHCGPPLFGCHDS